MFEVAIRELSVLEKQENKKCQILKLNRMTCQRNAVAFVELATEKVAQYNGKWVCAYHLAMLNHGITEVPIGDTTDSTDSTNR